MLKSISLSVAASAPLVAGATESGNTTDATTCSDIGGMWNAYTHGLCRIGTNAGVASGDGCTWSMVCGDSGFWQGGTVKGTKVASTSNADIHTVWKGDFTDDNTISWDGNLWTRAEENAGEDAAPLRTCTDIRGTWDTDHGVGNHGLCKMISNAGAGSGDGCTWAMVCGASGFWQGGDIDGTAITTTASDSTVVYATNFKDDNTIDWWGMPWIRVGEHADVVTPLGAIQV